MNKPTHFPLLFALTGLAVCLGCALFLALTTPANAAGGGGSQVYTQPDDKRGQSLQRQYRKGVRLAKKGDYDEALDILTKVVEAEPGHADALKYMGFCYRKQGDHKRAYQHYRRALLIDRRHRGALEYMGELFLDMNNLEKARLVHARLDEICEFGCAEQKALGKAIRAYEARTSQ